jgi:hypothetical protein
MFILYTMIKNTRKTRKHKKHVISFTKKRSHNKKSLKYRLSKKSRNLKLTLRRKKRGGGEKKKRSNDTYDGKKRKRSNDTYDGKKRKRSNDTYDGKKIFPLPYKQGADKIRDFFSKKNEEQIVEDEDMREYIEKQIYRLKNPHSQKQQTDPNNPEIISEIERLKEQLQDLDNKIITKEQIEQFIRDDVNPRMKEYVFTNKVGDHGKNDDGTLIYHEYKGLELSSDDEDGIDEDSRYADDLFFEIEKKN